MQLLDGVRVLDFGRFIAGPYCGALLADHGADVIRVERREGGEDRYLPPVAESGEGGLFLQLNRGKRCLTLDIAHQDGRAIVQALVRESDVVIANLPPPTLSKLGLDWPTLSALNPRLVLTTASAYGPEGPYRDRPGFDAVGQAMSGAMYMTGMPDQPVRSHANMMDFTTALGCAYGTMAALWAREKTGRGQWVDGSLLRSGLIMMNGTLIEQAVRHVDRIPRGNRGHTAAPGDAYRTRTGWVMVATVGDAMFERCCEMIGRPELIRDPANADDLKRGDNSAEISRLMGEWCAERTRDEVLAALEAARLPAAPIYSPQEALDDPHVQAAGLLQPMSFPGLVGTYPLAPHPVTMSESTLEQRPAPMLGQHTDEILRGIGMDDARIAALRASGVV